MAKSSKNSKSILEGSTEDDSRSVLGGEPVIDGSDEVKETLCEPCQKDGKSTDALDYCVDCSEFMCGKCSTLHKKFKSFQNHIIKDANRTYCEPCKKGGKTILAIKHCMNCTENLCGQCSDFHVKFKAFEYHTLKRTDEVNAATSGSITKMIKKSEEKVAELHIGIENPQQTPAHVKSSSKAFRMVSAELLTTIDLTTSEDEKIARIWGLTVVQKHYCVVIDKANRSIKAFDTRQYSITSKIYLWKFGNARHITSINDDKFAVFITVDCESSFHFFSVSSSGVLSDSHHSISILDKLFEYVIHNEGRIYGTIQNTIYVHDMQGKFIDFISVEEYCDDYYFLAVSNDHNTIYVGSHVKNKVFSLDMDYTVKATYQDESLDHAGSMTVDGEGYVYVCSLLSQTIHQLASDLSVCHVIISCDGLLSAFNKVDNRLLCSGRDGKITVYNVK